MFRAPFICVIAPFISEVFRSTIGPMRIGVGQMTSGSNLKQNLKVMEEMVRVAVDQGAQLVVLPEMAYFMGELPEWKKILQEFNATQELFASWARQFGCYLIPGTLREPIDDEHFYNTLAFFGPDGHLLGSYRKLFLFRARLPHRTYEESKHCTAGNEVVVVSTAFGRVGLSICFDLRFPELYRRLKSKGAHLIVAPSAFTDTTGKAHWDVLTRARAIENQVFLIAPNQVGTVGDGGHTHGHSRIVSPWGVVLHDQGTEVGVSVTSLNRNLIDQCRSQVDAWACRRDDLFSL